MLGCWLLGRLLQVLGWWLRRALLGLRLLRRCWLLRLWVAGLLLVWLRTGRGPGRGWGDGWLRMSRRVRNLPRAARGQRGLWWSVVHGVLPRTRPLASGTYPDRVSGARSISLLAYRFGPSGRRRSPDDVVVEEPLTIQLDGTTVSTTMRTPGNDFELAVGFCHGEGLLAGSPVESVRYCGSGPAVLTDFNVVEVDTGGKAPEPTPRLGMTTSSCGLCGADAIAELAERLEPISGFAEWDPEVLTGVPDRAAEQQRLFKQTGGSHAAAVFDRQGTIGVVREDIGRHNAVDKVVGRLLLDGDLDAPGRGLFVTGRASFEMVQKAWSAGFEVVVAVSAPSALAVSTARRAGLGLAGFARGGCLTMYAPEVVHSTP